MLIKVNPPTPRLRGTGKVVDTIVNKWLMIRQIRQAHCRHGSPQTKVNKPIKK